MEGKHLLCRYAEVNGTKPKSLRMGHVKSSQTAKEPSKETNPTPPQLVYIGVFSNDFATVDIRKGLCYHSRPKKQNSERGRV